jgi:hypothetical protein
MLAQMDMATRGRYLHYMQDSPGTTRRVGGAVARS